VWFFVSKDIYIRNTNMEEQALEWWNSLGPNPLLGLVERRTLTTKYYGGDRISKSLKEEEIVNIHNSEVGGEEISFNFKYNECTTQLKLSNLNFKKNGHGEFFTAKKQDGNTSVYNVQFHNGELLTYQDGNNVGYPSSVEDANKYINFLNTNGFDTQGITPEQIIGGEDGLEELVDKGGAKLGGDFPVSIGDDAYASTGNPKGAMQQTTDDYEKESQGGGRSKYMWGYAGGGMRESASKFKMKEMVEDIFTKKTFDDDMVKNFQNSDITRNGVPPLESMADSNPIIVRKVQLLSDVISRNSVSGEEKGIIINHLLDMDMSDVPTDFKNELKKKL
jgi:hypothetical protein